MAPATHRRWLVRVIMAMLTGAAIVFFIDAYADVWRDGQLRWPSGISWAWVIVSVVIGVVHVLAMAAAFAWLVGLHGRTRIASIFLLSQAAKYVPGKVWGVVAQQALLGDQSRLSRVVGANVAMAAILFSSQVALALAALLVPRVGMLASAMVGVAVSSLAGVSAAMLQRLHRAHAWRVLVPWARADIGRVTAVASLASLLLTATAWIALFGGGIGYGASEVVGWISISGASFVAGMLSVLPGGLGLREAVFVALGDQSGFIVSADGPMLALLTRAWLLAIDGVAVLLGIVGVVVLKARSR